MGTNYYAVKKKPSVDGVLHIGKSSIGWKFLFHSVGKYENPITDDELRTRPVRWWR